MSRRSLKPSKTDKVAVDKLRSFNVFYNKHMRKRLMEAAACYAFITPPPYARDENGEPDYNKVDSDGASALDVGRWFDNRLGSQRARQLSAQAWELRGSYHTHKSSQFPTVRHYYAHIVTLNEAATRSEIGAVWPASQPLPSMHVSLSALAYGYNPECALRAPSSQHFLDIADSDAPWFAPDSVSEKESMVEWVSGVVQRRREAFGALCFLQMIANNGLVSTASIFRQFPMVKQTAVALGVPSPIMAEASLPWRGHNDDLVYHIMDADPPLAGEKPFPWVRWNIQTELLRIAKQGLEPMLSALTTAMHAYHPRMPYDPSAMFRVSRPWSTDPRACAFSLPTWLRRYHHPVANTGSNMVQPHPVTGFWNSEVPYRQLMLDMATTFARVP